MSGPAPEAGDVLLELEIGAVAHGGHCVARYEGRVVFVRHCLPGELVRARVDELGPEDRYWRAEAVEVLRASPDRVTPPCPLSGPGGCGGCDWQHVAVPAQRRLKAAVVAEQLSRLAGIELPDLIVEPVPGDTDGLGWRTRVRFSVDDAGWPGLRGHRSHAVLPVPDCPIAHPDVRQVAVGTRRWPGTTAVEVVAGSAAGEDNLPLVVVEPRHSPDRRPARVDVPPLPVEVALARRGADGLTRIRGRTWVQESVLIDGAERRFRVTGSGFWQVHPGAARTLLDAVLEATDPQPGERAADLYCGAGLFTAGLAARVGPKGQVIGVEADARAAADARRSLHDLPRVGLEEGPVQRVLPRLASPHIVVLDPPRAGAGRRVVEAILRHRPRVIAYVACDPASLARDLAIAAAAGYRLDRLRAFDLFPMTQHVECVATLRPA